MVGNSESRVGRCAGYMFLFVPCLLVGLLALIRVLHFYGESDAVLVGVVPDDAFYYIQLAKHFVESGAWTFDGSSPATGFHLLYGYFLVVVFWVVGDIAWRELYLFVGVISSLSIGLSALFACKAVNDVYGRGLAPVAIIPFLSPVAIMQSTAMMESCLVLLFASLTVFSLIGRKTPTRWASVGLMGVGILGSLARTDYGMLPGVLFCVSVIACRGWRGVLVYRAALLLSGAILGLFVVFAQNYMTAGSIFQASAQIKLYWSSIIGHSVLRSLSLVQEIIFPFSDRLAGPVSFFLSLAIFCLVIVLWLTRSRVDVKGLNVYKYCFFFSGLLSLIFYVVFYSRNSWALQPWYSSNLIIPVSLIFPGVFLFLFKGRSFVPVLLVLGVYASFAVFTLFAVQWPHQAGMMHAGRFIQDEPKGFRFGAWNAGIISFFSGAVVTNIDGLANDEALPYIKSNSLLDYLILKNVDYLVDYQEMFSNKSLRLRGGYNELRSDICIVPLGIVDGGSPQWGGSSIMLYKVDQACLAEGKTFTSLNTGTYRFDDPRIQLTGWSSFENDHVWSLGVNSSIRFMIRDKHFKQVRLDIEPFGIQRLAVVVNGEPVSNVLLDGRHELFIDEKYFSKGENLISLAHPDATTPGGDDTRTLAILLRRVTVE